MVTDTVLLLLFVVPEFIVLFILGLDIFEFAHILTASFMIGGEVLVVQNHQRQHQEQRSFGIFLA